MCRNGQGKPTPTRSFRGAAPQLSTQNVERTIRLQATTLWLFGALVGLAGAVVLGQLLVRQQLLNAGDDAVLRALGMRRRDLAALGAARGVLVGLIAALIAAIVAVAVSPSRRRCRSGSRAPWSPIPCTYSGYADCSRATSKTLRSAN